MTARARFSFGVQLSERGRTVNNPNGPTAWTPQVSPSVTQPLEDFDRRPAALPTRHGNKLGTVHFPGFLGSDKTTCPAGRPTEQVFNAHTYGGVERDAPASIGAPAHRNNLAAAVPAY